MYLSENLQKKWAPILDHPELGKIDDPYRKAVTTVLLENQEKSMQEDNQVLSSQNFLTEAGQASGAFPDQGGVAKYDPIMISLVRRAMPNLIAYDVCGVQPMTGPTGLIFAMRARYVTMSQSPEALYNEADTNYSANSDVTQTSNVPGLHIHTDGSANASHTLVSGGLTTAAGETMTPNNMAFSIEKVTVTAKTRALRADYTMEVAQDLKAVHGLDAETELSNILSAEILAEINREVIRKIYREAVIGAQNNTTQSGIFDLDTDSNGRWSVEKFKGLMFQIEREANEIAKKTRRGKGNMIICSADVASALQMSGVLDYAPALATNLNVDDTGNTFAGVLNGKFKVYIDPYSANIAADQFYVVGYKGTSPYDSGLFYCPYVPLQMVRAVGQDSFQPKIGFKTRYGMVANPFATTNGTGAIDITSPAAGDQNVYYRRVKVSNIM